MPIGFAMSLAMGFEFIMMMPIVREIIYVTVLTGLAITGLVVGICSATMGEGCPGIEELRMAGIPDFNATVGPCNVPMYNFAICRDQIKEQLQPINSSIPEPGVAQFDYIPPACMNLANVLVGACDDVAGHYPVVCGSSCLKYTGLSDAEMKALSAALNSF